MFSDRVHHVAFQVALNKLSQFGSDFDLVGESFNVSYFNSLDARKGKTILLLFHQILVL